MYILKMSHHIFYLLFQDLVLTCSLCNKHINFLVHNIIFMENLSSFYYIIIINFNSIIILISLSNILSSSSNSYSIFIAKVSLLFYVSHIRNTDPNDPSPNNSPILKRPQIKSPLFINASSLLRFINYYYIFSNSLIPYIFLHMLVE